MTASQLIEIYQSLSLVATAAGVFVIVISMIAYQNLMLGVPLALDFWTAGGFLKLMGVPSWSTLATAAALVAIRKVVVQFINSSQAKNIRRRSSLR